MVTPQQAAQDRRHDHEITGEERLAELGYESRFQRRLTLTGNMSLTLSDITPMGSLLSVGLAVVALAGTGAVISYLAGAFIAVMVAFCMAELGATFPISGGIYSIVGRVLGRHVAFLALVGYVVEAIFLPATIALAIGTYLNSLNSSFDVGIWAAVAMAVVTVLALLRIQANAIMTGIFLSLEVLVIIVIAVAGFSNVRQSLSVFTRPEGIAGGNLTTLGLGVVVGAIAVALQSVNGYDAAIAFAEETKGPSRTIGKAVLYTCLVGAVLELAAFIGAALGAPDLKTYLTSSTPLTYVVVAHWGHVVGTVVVAGAILALFNACLAITLQFARILWASGRDRVWPEVISKPLHLTWARTHAPWVATLFIGVLAVILCLSLSLVATVTFVAVFTITNYVFVAVAAIVHRVKSPGSVRPFRLPLWPVPPIIAGAGSLIAISQQSPKDIVIVAALLILGLIYSVFYVRRKRIDVTALTSDAAEQ